MRNMGKMLFKELRRLGFDVDVDTRMKLVLDRPQNQDSEESIKHCDELDVGRERGRCISREQEVDMPMR
jgi:hypothetical protein